MHGPVKVSRRALVKAGAALSGATFLRPDRLFGAAADNGPHFLLQVLIYPGADSAYLFDARPLAMKAASLVQNYTNKDPLVWDDGKGGKALAYDHMEPLRPLFPYFSVVNGVHMALGFQGHDNSVNQLFAGNPLGGKWFLPRLSEGLSYPLEHVRFGDVFGNISNLGGGVALDGFSGSQIKSVIASKTPEAADDPLLSGVRARIQASAGGTGLFSQGATAMLKGIDAARVLEGKLATLGAGADPADTAFRKNYKSAVDFFKGNLAGGGLIVFQNFAFDCHDATNAKAQPANFGALAGELKGLIDYLRATPYDAQRSMYEVTTLMISPEFARTMHQLGKPIDETGTDHNTLANSVMLGGKGIKGGLIIGATDFESVDAYAAPSGAHKKMDPSLNMLMGKPFDFATSQVSTAAAPATYDSKDYLTAGSVVNTVFRLFGVTDERLHNISGSAGAASKAPVIGALLADG